MTPLPTLPQNQTHLCFTNYEACIYTLHILAGDQNSTLQLLFKLNEMLSNQL